MIARMKGLFFRSIQARLITFIFLVVLLPLIFLGVMTLRASSLIIEKSVTLNSAESMDQVLDNIEFYLKDIESVATDIIFNPTVISELKKTNGSYDLQDIQAVNAIKAVLNKQLSVKNSLKSVFLLGDRYFIMSSDNTFVMPVHTDTPEQMKDQMWYSKALARGGKSFFTIVEAGSGTSGDRYASGNANRTIRLARLLRHIQSGEPIGVLGVDMDYRVIDNVVSKLHTEYNGALFLVDEDGNMIYKRDPKQRFTEEGLRSDIGIADQESGVDEISVQGSKMLRIYRTSPLSGWRVIQLIPASEVLAPVTFIQKWTIILVVISMAVALIMSVFVSNRVVKPLRNLVSLMKKVQMGELDVKLDHNRNDEIGHLSRNFNMMTTRLQEMHSEIYKEQELKRQAELSALQAQIQPHFLYNTLDSIKWMAVMRGERQISDMITALVNLLRNSINLGNETITVRQEIDNLHNYIRIQQMRYYHTFDIEYRIDEQVLGAGIPKLILQPLVENALFHGIDSMEKGGRIELDISLDGSHFVCRIADNGKGMSPVQLEEIMSGQVKSRFSGISIKNVDERLKLHYGKQYGLIFHSEPGRGTEVTFRFPAIAL